MDRKKELSSRLVRNSLKRVVAEMNSFTLLEIYDDDNTETKYYARLTEKFCQLSNLSKLQEKHYPISPKDYENDITLRWILNEVPCISDDDEWIISGSGMYHENFSRCYALIKGNDRLACVRDLWNMDKYSNQVQGRQALGYVSGFYAINKTIGTIIEVGIFSNDEYHYTLSTLEI
jgi:hypothetical protein